MFPPCPTRSSPGVSASAALARALRRLGRPVDAAALASFRVVFGTLLLVAVIRYAAKGMITRAFVEPAMFFPLVPFLGPLPPPGMHLVFLALGLLAACIAVGFQARAAAGLFCLLFSYAHFADLTNYLNHYYLVSLLTGLMAVMPTARIWSVDAWRAGAAPSTVPVWTLWLLRFQIACVYFFAGVAKLRSDWIVQALPLRIWLPGSGDVPLIGPLLGRPETAFLMSWAGAAFDLTVPFWLLWRRSRPFALAAAVVFHLLTVPLFRLGMFPFIMMAGSLLFLEPGWSRRLLRLPGAPLASGGRGAPISRGALACLAAYVAFQVLLPLRHHVQGPDLLWSERGYRFAWHVMLMEKNGVADFTVRDLATGREQPARLRDHLTPLQVKMMSTQPDLIRAFARRLADEARAQGRQVAVLADVLVSLNGRPAGRLVDPSLDLGGERLPAGWLLAGPVEPPP